MENTLRRVFYYLNKFFMVPMFRLGFGAWMGTPFGGYIMVLKTIGKKTGKTRYAPVNYAIENGNVYCIAGFGKTSDWYRNIRAHPTIEMMMPGGTIAGIAEDVVDQIERLRVIRQIMINAGFAGFFYGENPRTMSDDVLSEKTQDVPLLRIRPIGIGAGAYDAGGWAWIVSVLATVLSLVWLVRRPKGRS